jgi:hypothetical protein
MKSRWILRYLNTRYFRFPEGVRVRSREGWELPRSDTRHNFLRVVEGQGAWLDKNCEYKGSVELTQARAHWWILKPSIDKDSGHFAPGGHIAALYHNELYEMMFGRAGLARLQAFGAIFGTDRVVIYIEPELTAERPVTSNTARTHLLLGGEPLDWATWAGEFRDRMPEPLVALQEQIGAQAGEKDHRKAIAERLKQIRDLLRFSRFRPAKDGSATVEPDATMPGGEPSSRGSKPEGDREPGKRWCAGISTLFAGLVRSRQMRSVDAPRPQWVAYGQYAHPSTSTIEPPVSPPAESMISADFRVFWIWWIDGPMPADIYQGGSHHDGVDGSSSSSSRR